MFISEAGKSEMQFSAQEHIKKEVVVFVYHRFGDPRFPITNISLQEFEDQLSYLKSQDFTVMKFGDAVDYITNPEKPFVEKVACITVDDGYLTFYDNAMPLLHKYGYKATVFINSESVKYSDFMNWEQLKAISDDGIEIGNHSHSHAYFVDIPANDRIRIFKSDLQKCQENIQQHLGFSPDVFAYPYGEFDLEMKGVLKNLGFKAAAAQNSGVMHNHDIYAIARFPMAGPFTKIEAFKEKANMHALRIENKIPESSIVEQQNNPPMITIQFDSSGVDLTRYNCFISEECESSRDGSTIILKAKQKLKNRRTLYKITAPAKNGKGWYWYSHLWIQPNIKE